MTSKSNIQYLTDESGKKKAVLIPIEDWEKIQASLEELAGYREMRQSLKRAFQEVKEIKSGKLPKKTLKNFLNEI
jgi:hypothetical protein